MAYDTNTDGFTMNGILAALTDLGAKFDALTDALKANTRALAIGTGQPTGDVSQPGYIDPDTGDIYMQQQQG